MTVADESEALAEFVREFPTLGAACRFQAQVVLEAERDGTMPAYVLAAIELPRGATVGEMVLTWRWLAKRARERSRK